MVEYGAQSQTSGGGQGSSTQQQSQQDRMSYGDPSLSNITGLQFLQAFVDQTGEDVTLIAACNWQGHSLADIAVNRRGKQSLGAAEEFTVIDPRAVPNVALTELRQRQIQIQQQRGQTQNFGQLTTR